MMTPTPSTSHTIQIDTSPSVGRHAPVPGVPLARLKGQLAINTFLQRFPEAPLAVSSEPVRWRQGLSLYGLGN
jgi:cytochrome P450